MRKFLVITLVLITALVLFGPAAVGFVAEREHHTLMRDAAGRDDRGVLQVAGYERGWFSSNARYHYFWRSHPGAEPIELWLDTDLRHGRALSQAGGGTLPTFAIAAGKTRASIQLKGKRYPLPGVLHTAVGPGGEGLLRYQSEHLGAELPNELLLEGLDADLRARIDRKQERIEAEGHIGSLTVSDPHRQIELEDLSLTSKQQRAQGGLWTGATSIAIDRLSIREPASATDLSLDQLLLESALSLTEGRAQLRVDATAHAMRGPRWTGEQAELAFDAEALDAAVLARVLTGMALDGASGNASKLSAGLTALLESGVEFDLERLHVPTPEGPLQARLRIELPPLGGLPLFPGALMSLDASASLALPQALAENAARRDERLRSVLTDLLRRGVLRSEADRYAIDAAYRRGALTVNGEPLELLPLLW